MKKIREEILTDEQVARKIQKGSEDDYRIIVERYQSRLLRYARRFLFGYDDASDLVQEVFLKAYVNIQGFDAKRRFSPWIYRIAHNEFVNAIRKKGKEPLPLFDLDTFLPHSRKDGNNVEEIMRQKDLKIVLEENLSKIDPKYREPLVLYYFEELSYKEIADVMHIPTSTVGVRIRRGKAKMQKLLKELDL